MKTARSDHAGTLWRAGGLRPFHPRHAAGAGPLPSKRPHQRRRSRAADGESSARLTIPEIKDSLPFTEPMITVDFLKETRDACFDISHPEEFRQVVYYPTKYCVRRNERGE